MIEQFPQNWGRNAIRQVRYDFKCSGRGLCIVTQECIEVQFEDVGVKELNM